MNGRTSIIRYRNKLYPYWRWIIIIISSQIYSILKGTVSRDGIGMRLLWWGFGVNLPSLCLLTLWIRWANKSCWYRYRYGSGTLPVLWNEENTSKWYKSHATVCGTINSTPQSKQKPEITTYWNPDMRHHRFTSGVTGTGWIILTRDLTSLKRSVVDLDCFNTDPNPAF
jgi:hypothetical protein